MPAADRVSDVNSDVEVAISAALAGAAVVMSKYGAWETRIDKGPGDFATEADVEAERAILEVIRAARPDDAFLGEEGGYVGAEGAARVWLVDPLCGTLNFAAQTPLFCVNVMLRDGERDLAAGIADPCSGELFWADQEGAWLRRNGTDVPLAPSDSTRLVDVNVDRPTTDVGTKIAAFFANPDFETGYGRRVLSTSLPLAWVAAGRRAAYVTEGAARDSVHFAAGLALCEVAGCVVTNLDGGPRHTGIGGLVVAADADSHADLLRILAAS